MTDKETRDIYSAIITSQVGNYHKQSVEFLIGCLTKKGYKIIQKNRKIVAPKIKRKFSLTYAGGLY